MSTHRHGMPSCVAVVYDRITYIEMQKGVHTVNDELKGQRFYHKFTEATVGFGIPPGTIMTFPDGRQVELPKKTLLLVGGKDIWERREIYER